MTERLVDLYLRQSMDRSGEELAVSRQEDECRAYCESRGWTVGKVYVDNDISATSRKIRPAFEQLLSDKPPAIVVWHTDRLVRATRDLERVIELGVNVYALKAGELDLSTPSGRAVARTITAWATYEGEQKSLRYKSSARQKANTGRPNWSVVPFGFTDERSLNEPEATLIRRAYSDVLAGRPLRRIATEWNDAGATSRRGGAWKGETLRALLLAPRNAGLRAYNGEILGKGSWPEIVPEEVWRATQALLTAPERQHGSGGNRPTNLLSGLAWCGACHESRVAISNSTDKPHKGRTFPRAYRCPKCGKLARKADWVEELVTATVLELLRRDDLVDLLAVEQGPDVADILAKRDALRTQLDQLGEAAGRPGASVTQLVKAMESVQGHLEVLEEQLAAAGGLDVLSPLLAATDVEAAWAGLGLERQRTVLNMFWTITIQPSDGSRWRSADPSMVTFEPKASAGVQPAAAAAPA